MARPKKDSVALNINIEAEINDKLVEFCDITGLTKTKSIEKAIDRIIEIDFLNIYKKVERDISDPNNTR